MCLNKAPRSNCSKTVNKYGIEEARKIIQRGRKYDHEQMAKIGRMSGSLPKSDDHKASISESVKRRWAEGRCCGRKPITLTKTQKNDVMSRFKNGETMGSIIKRTGISECVIRRYSKVFRGSGEIGRLI